MFDEAVRTLLSWLATFALIGGGLYMSHLTFDFSKPVIELWLPLAPFRIILIHTIRRTILSFLRMHGLNTRYYAILGANSLGHRLKAAFTEMPWLGYSFVGFFDDRSIAISRLDDDGRPIAGNFKDLLTMPEKAKSIISTLLCRYAPNKGLIS